MDGARAAEATLGRRLVVRVEPAARRPARLPGAVGDGLESERVFEQAAARLRCGRVRMHRVEALQRMLRRNLRMLRHEWRVVHGRDDETVP